MKVEEIKSSQRKHFNTRNNAFELPYDLPCYSLTVGCRFFLVEKWYAGVFGEHVNINMIKALKIWVANFNSLCWEGFNYENFFSMLVTRMAAVHAKINAN